MLGNWNSVKFKMDCVQWHYLIYDLSNPRLANAVQCTWKRVHRIEKSHRILYVMNCSKFPRMNPLCDPKWVLKMSLKSRVGVLQISPIAALSSNFLRVVGFQNILPFGRFTKVLYSTTVPPLYQKMAVIYFLAIQIITKLQYFVGPEILIVQSPFIPASLRQMPFLQ